MEVTDDGLGRTDDPIGVRAGRAPARIDGDAA